MNNESIKRLYELQSEIKKLQAEEKKIKDCLKKELDFGEYIFDDVVVSLSSRVRSSVDSKMLVAEFGDKFVDKYSKKTEYSTVSLKKVKNINKLKTA